MGLLVVEDAHKLAAVPRTIGDAGYQLKAPPP